MSTCRALQRSGERDESFSALVWVCRGGPRQRRAEHEREGGMSNPAHGKRNESKTDEAVESREVVIDRSKREVSENGSAGGIGRMAGRHGERMKTEPKQTEDRRSQEE